MDTPGRTAVLQGCPPQEPEPVSIVPALSLNPTLCRHTIPQKSVSSIGALLGSSRALERLWPRKSKRFASFSEIERIRYERPIALLASLVKTLKDNHVPGPILIRLETEFTHPLGAGAQFEVTGIAPRIVAKLGGPSLREVGKSFEAIAVKKPKITARMTAISGTGTESSLDPQIRALHREISALSHDRFKDHPHIVKLLGWGLCLDSLERKSDNAPIIPLLILERAEYNLGQFLFHRRQKVQRLDHWRRYGLYRGICLGVGEGIGVLHAEGITHGDLKLENILLFQTATGGWVPKLCDFGLSAELDETVQNARYHGTNGWRAPEVVKQDRKPIRVQLLKMCDIFAYGLVVRCVFTEFPNAPLSREDEGENGNALISCSAAVTESAGQWLPKDKLTLVLVCLYHSLQNKAFLRSQKPWRVFDDTYADGFLRRLMDRGVVSRSLRTSIHSLGKVRKVLLERLVQPACDKAAIVGWFTRMLTGSLSHLISLSLAGPSTLLMKIGRQMDRLLLPFIRRERQNIYLTMFRRYAQLLNFPQDPNSIAPFTHPDGVCLRLESFYADIEATAARCRAFSRPLGGENWAVDPVDMYRLYALARLRSRLRWCCWERITASRAGYLTIVEDVVNGPHELRTLSWLCRGEVGQGELQQIQNSGRQPWGSLYTGMHQGGCDFQSVEDHRGPLKPDGEGSWICSHSSHDYTGCSYVKSNRDDGIRGHQLHHEIPHRLTVKERVERFLLLLEMGYNFHQLPSSRNRKMIEQTAFCKFLETFKGNVTDERSDRFQITFRSKPQPEEELHNLIRHFRGIAQTQSTNDESRYFLTGHLPEHVDIRNAKGFSTTALHEAVRACCYPAVEYLLRSGFVANARDRNNKTALQISIEWRQRDLADEDWIQLSRIIALLDQNQGISFAPVLSPHFDLPLGWRTIFSSFGITIYQEAYTSSITLSRPRFGLFDDRSLALGHRELAVEGQTFFLDLVYFLTSDKTEDKTPYSERKFNDCWFTADVAQTRNLVLTRSQYLLAKLSPVSFLTFCGGRFLALLKSLILPALQQNSGRPKTVLREEGPTSFFTDITQRIIEVSRMNYERAQSSVPSMSISVDRNEREVSTDQDQPRRKSQSSMTDSQREFPIHVLHWQNHLVKPDGEGLSGASTQSRSSISRDSNSESGDEQGEILGEFSRLFGRGKARLHGKHSSLTGSGARPGSLPQSIRGGPGLEEEVVAWYPKGSDKKAELTRLHVNGVNSNSSSE